MVNKFINALICSTVHENGKILIAVIVLQNYLFAQGEAILHDLILIVGNDKAIGYYIAQQVKGKTKLAMLI